MPGLRQLKFTAASMECDSLPAAHSTEALKTRSSTVYNDGW